MKKYLLLLSFFLAFGVCDGQKKYQLSKPFLELQKQIQANYYQYEKTDQTLLLVNQLILKAENPLEKGVALIEKSSVLLFCTIDYNAGEIGLPIAFEAAKILENAGEREWYHKAWHQISMCYGSKYAHNDGLQGWEKVLKYNNIALKIQTDSTYMPNVPFFDTFEDKRASRKTLIESIEATKENLKMWEKLNSIPHKMWRNQRLATLHWSLNHDFGETEKYLLISKNYAELLKNDDFKHAILIQMTVIANSDRKYEKAKYYGNINLQNALNLKNELRESLIRDQLFITYKALGDNNTALNHKIRSLEISQKLTRNTESTRNKLFKERNVILEKQASLQEELKKQNTYKWWLSFVVALLLAGLLFMFYYNFNLKKQNEEISAAHLQGKTTERQRVASDLHDNIGSTLSALWLSIDNIDKSKLSKKDISLIDMLRINLEKAYDDVRLLSHNLLPKALEKKGLTAALKGLVAKVNQTSSVYFNLEIDTEFPKLNNTIEFEIYSIILELVNNIMKHAQATEAFIILKTKDKVVNLEVSDNGQGYAEPDVSGFGFDNIDARVRSINGVWKVENTSGTGVINTIQIPI